MRRSTRRSTPTAQPCVIAVPLGNRTVLVAVWRVRLGRVTLYLLDTDLEENAPWDRELSARLYGGDRETRIQQEIILGIGGVRALKALGIDAGGVAPERRARRVRRAAAHPRSDRAGRDASSRRSRKSAGRRSSPPTRRCRPGTTRFRSAWSRRTWPARGARSAPSRDAFLALGHYDNGSGPLFNMTALALRAAGFVNGVSQLHGQVTREMWGPIWPGVADDDAAGAGDHQRRPRADLAVVRHGERCSTPTSTPDWLRAPRRSRRSGRRFSTSRTTSCGASRSALRNYLFTFIRERARQRWKVEHVSRAARRRRRHAARSRTR